MDEKGISKRLKTQIVTFRKWFRGNHTFEAVCSYSLPPILLTANAKPTDIMNAAFPEFTKVLSAALGEPQPREAPTNNASGAASSLSSAASGINGALAAAQQMTAAAVNGVASAVASVVHSTMPGSSGNQ